VHGPRQPAWLPGDTSLFVLPWGSHFCLCIHSIRIAPAHLTFVITRQIQGNCGPAMPVTPVSTTPKIRSGRRRTRSREPIPVAGVQSRSAGLHRKHLTGCLAQELISALNSICDWQPERRITESGLRIPATHGNARNAAESDLHGTTATKQGRSWRRRRDKAGPRAGLGERRAGRRNRHKTGEQRAAPATKNAVQERSAAHPGFQGPATHSNSAERTCGDLAKRQRRTCGEAAGKWRKRRSGTRTTGNDNARQVPSAHDAEIRLSKRMTGQCRSCAALPPCCS